MPCDSITTYGVTLAKCVDHDILAAAARDLGYRVSQYGRDGLTFSKGRTNITLSGGNARVTGVRSQEEADSIQAELVRGYSRKVVQAAAEKWGWQVSEKGEKLVVRRRA